MTVHQNKNIQLPFLRRNKNKASVPKKKSTRVYAENSNYIFDILI
tara:strand:- start:56 stop:190 length:135 start_codon:yes stop_codon:yes gene_type:complete